MVLAGPPGVRVLICDDNVDAAYVLKQAFGLERHEVCVCNDGISCLETARQWRPDVVILDIGMPGLTGYEVAERLRSLEDAPRVLIIALSGWGTDSDRARSSAAGIDLHITKPADITTLLAAVRSAPASRSDRSPPRN